MKRLALVSCLIVASCKSQKPRDELAPKASASTAPVEVASACPAPSASASPATICAGDDWPTYQHDPARTGASPGCATGRFRVDWSFTPAGPKGREAEALHAIAAGDAVYLTGKKGNSPAMYAVDARTGELRWEHDTRADIERPAWPTFALGSVVLNDDGFYLLSPATGKNRWDRGLDTWGQSLSDGTHWFLTNTWHVEGPGVYVGAFDATGKSLWKANKFGSVKEDVMDDVGALALDGATLFHAANYKFAPHSAISALDTATGKKRWHVSTVPISDISTGHGLVYGIQRAKRGEPAALVARRRETGEVAFSVPVTAPAAWAPVVARDLVITALDATTLLAVRAATGEIVYRASAQGPLAAKLPETTAVIAALGSDTLVVTAGSSVLSFSLPTGALLGEIAGDLPDARDPVLVGERLYVGSRARVVALSPSR